MKTPKPVKTTWASKEGDIRICDMRDSHLINCIRMLERIAKEHMKRAGGVCCGDFEDVWYDEEPYDGPEDVSPKYKDLTREAKRRGLL